MWGHCFFLLGPGAHKVLFVPSKSLFLQSYVTSVSSMVELMVTSSKGAYAILKLAVLRVPGPHSSPQLTHNCSGDTQTLFFLSLCGVSESWCTQICFSPLSISGRYGVFDSKHDFAPPTILLGLLLCPWTWGISSQSLQHHAASNPRGYGIFPDQGLNPCPLHWQADS